MVQDSPYILTHIYSRIIEVLVKSTQVIIVCFRLFFMCTNATRRAFQMNSTPAYPITSPLDVAPLPFRIIILIIPPN